MEERRKHRRLPIKLEIDIDKLFKQDNEIIHDINESIEVINISRTGLGFLCKDNLPLDYYFNAKIEFDKFRYFYCVLKIIRKEVLEDTHLFGCEFVGLAEFLSHKVDEYEMLLDEKNSSQESH
jgi:hypothetical protein